MSILSMQASDGNVYSDDYPYMYKLSNIWHNIIKIIFT